MISSALEAYLASPLVTRREGVYFLSDPTPFEEKERRYWNLRTREGRAYSDEVVRRLPRVAPGDPLASEWAARADSLSRLLRYVSQRPRAQTILDLGCGNGWLANHLASLPSTHVYGLDLNRRELAQAARVFGDNPRLKFVYGDLFGIGLPEQSFDLVVLASVVQYFPDLPALVRCLWPLLIRGGELHILDSPVYAPAEVAAARARTRAYYEALGSPEMAAEYHHHPTTALAPFQPAVLYEPRAWRNRLAQRLGIARSPFLWICLTPGPSPDGENQKRRQERGEHCQ